jgi:hypothetical protein
MYASYLHANAKPHGYIVLDLTQGINYLLRFRTVIFRNESPPLIYAPVDYETDTIDLSHATRS